MWLEGGGACDVLIHRHDECRASPTRQHQLVPVPILTMPLGELCGRACFHNGCNNCINRVHMSSLGTAARQNLPPRPPPLVPVQDIDTTTTMQPPLPKFRCRACFSNARNCIGREQLPLARADRRAQLASRPQASTCRSHLRPGSHHTELRTLRGSLASNTG